MCTYSLEHTNYLKKLKREKVIIFTFRILIISIFLITWEVLARLSIINTFLFSSPSRIINTLINNKDLFKHISVTLYEVFISFSLATILGIIISTIMWRYSIFSMVIDPYITIINSLPKVALGPLIIIWVGASTNSIIVMALTINLFATIINIYTGFTSVDKNYITMLRSFNASKFDIYRYVVIPSNIVNIISTLKINISMSLIGVIMGELLVSKAGLGYLIMYGSQVFNLDLVISSIFVLGIISYIMYFILDKVSKKLTNYS